MENIKEQQESESHAGQNEKLVEVKSSCIVAPAANVAEMPVIGFGA